MRFSAFLLMFGLLGAFAACSSSNDSAVAPDEDGGGDGGTKPPGLEELPIPTEPAIAYVGRFAIEGEARTFGWSGSRIVARFKGTSVSVTLAATSLDQGPSVFDVKVDDKVQVLSPEEGAKTYALAQDLAAGEHVVELILRTEGQVGVTTFRGFDFGGGGTLLPPPRPRSRRVEILGDSTATGYGIEGDGPDCEFSAATENFGKSWGARLGVLLDADVTGIVFSGKGVLQNNDRSDKVLFEQIYGRTVPTSPAPAWDFTKESPVMGAVVIMLGGNDWDQPDPNVFDAPDFGRFKAKYAKLVALVREKHPRAYIFAVLSPTQSNDYPSGFDARSNQKRAFTEVVADRTAGGDANVHFVDVTEGPESERDACEFHPGVGLHERIAKALAAAVKTPTGW